MNKEKIISEIAGRHGLLIGKDDPAFYIVDLATMVIEEKAEEIREAVGKAEQSIPYLLDLKRKEIDEAAARILAASDDLEAQRKQLAETLQQDVDNELRERVEGYTRQVMEAIENRIELAVEKAFQERAERILDRFETQVEQLARVEEKRHGDRIKEILWQGAIGIVSGVFALALFVTFFV